MNWQFVIAGLLVGVLVGMTGMGGGSLMTPMLILIFGFDPKTAVGTDLVHGAVFKSFGAMRHRRLGTVNLPLAAWMLLGSGPCSLIGVELANSFSDDAAATMTRVIGAALILGGIGFLARTFVDPHRDVSDGPFRLSRRDKIVAVVIGASCGFVVGLTSVGSGTFFGLFMLFLFPLSATQMVGTDVTHAAALLWIAGAGYLLHGNVDMHAIAWLLVGSIPGVLLGSNLSIKVPDRMLRTTFAIVLMLSGVKLVELPGATIIIEATIAVAALAAVAWSLRQLQQRRVAAEGSA